MPASPTAPLDSILRQFEGAWRDDTPVFGCCRRAVEMAVHEVDLLELATMDVTARVQELRAGVDAQLPDHLDSHRCCAGHLADLAFDLPDLIVTVEPSEG